MKKTIGQIRKSSLLVMIGLFSISTVLFTACKDEAPTDSKEMAEDHNEAKFDNKADEKDAQFLVNAAEINLAEIQLGQLAQSSSKMKDVTNLGAMMEKGHRSMLKELESLAVKKMVTVPATITEKGQEEFNRLKEKAGKDFDKKYCQMMVDGHKDAIDKFQKASENAVDTEIRSWATNTLPALKMHLEHSETCLKKREGK